MSHRLYQRIRSASTGTHLLVLFALTLLCLWGFACRRMWLNLPPDTPVLDAAFFYTPAYVASLFQALGPDRLELYAYSEITLDLAFPLAYGFLFGGLIASGWSERVGHLLVPLPIATASADALENLSVFYLALNFDGTPSAFASVAASLTVLKTGLWIASLLAAFLGLCRLALRRIRRPDGTGTA